MALATQLKLANDHT